MAKAVVGGATSASVGSTFSYVITFANGGPSTAANATVTDNLAAAGLSLLSAQASVGTLTTSSTALSLAAGPLASGASGTITLTVQVSAGTGSITNVASITSTTPDPTPANNTATSTISRIDSADVSVTVSLPATGTAGQTLTGTITFTNNGPSPAAGVGGTVTVAGGTLTAVQGGTVVGGTGTTAVTPSLPNGSTTFYTFSFVVGTGTSVTSTGVVTTTTADSNTANNTSQAVVTLAVLSDVGTTLSMAPSAPASSVASGTVTFFNIGPATANNVTRTVFISGGTITAVSGGTVAVGSVTATFPIATLAAGSSASFTFTYAMPASGSVNGTSSIATTTAEGNFANNKATAVTVVSGVGVDLSVTLTVSPKLLVAGTNTVAVTVSNVGTLPSGGSVTVSLPPNSTTLASTVSFVLASPLSPGQTVTFTTTYQLDLGQASSQTFTARVTATGGLDTNPTNDVSTVVVGTGARVQGTAWVDSDRLGPNFRTFQSATETVLPNIFVKLTNSSSVVVGTAFTDINGRYSIEGVPAGTGYRVEFFNCLNVTDTTTCNAIGTTPMNMTATTAFLNPSTGSTSATTSVSGTTVGQAITGITLYAGDNTVDQNLPVDPSGVVYDSQTRAPVNGATVSLFGPYGPGGTPALVPAANLIGGVNQCISGVNCGALPGGYQFFLQGPGLVNGTYTIQITPPAGYSNSTILPSVFPQNPVGPGAPFLAQPQGGPPPAAAATTYYVSFNYVFGAPRDILNNHLPLDPGNGGVSGALLVTKTGSKTVAEIGDSVQYTIRIRNTTASDIKKIQLKDTLPAGFRYILGTARLGSATLANPAGGVGRELTFDIGTVAAQTSVDLTYFVRLGVGSQQGDGINSAQAFGTLTSSISITSNVSKFKVNVQGGVFSNEGCIIGKVYVDCDGNAMQNSAGGDRELGIPGVRLVMLDGTFMITDPEGKYSICGIKSQTHVIKVDRTTLPVGSRLVPSSNRNAGVGDSIFVDLKGGELGRADFIEGSCSREVMDQVKARRAQGPVTAPETEKVLPLRIENRPGEVPVQILPAARQINLVPADAGGMK